MAVPRQEAQSAKEREDALRVHVARLRDRYPWWSEHRIALEMISTAPLGLHPKTVARIIRRG